MNSVIIIALILFLAALFLLRLQRKRPLLQYIFFIRHSLFVGLVLVGLAPLALYVIPNMGQNLFVIDTIWGVGLVTALSILAAWVVMFTALLTIRAAPFVMLDIYKPLHAPAWLPQWVIRHRAWFFALLALPILVAVYVHSTHINSGWVALIRTVPPWVQQAGLESQWAQAVEIAPAWSRIVGIALGVVPAWLLLGIATLLRRWFSPLLDRVRARQARWLRSLLGPLPASIQHAYSDQNVRSVRHDEAVGFFVLTLAIYFLGFVVLRPDAPLLDVPALSYFLLMLILIGWLLPGLALILDRWRVPTLFTLLAVSYIFWGVANFTSSTGHVYNVLARPADATRRPSQPLTPARVYQLWAERHPVADYPVMTLVTVSGGGISSATWSSQVLSGLQAQLGAKFSDSVLLFSTVSGGSVGVLNFVDAFGTSGPPVGDAALNTIVSNAGSESLSPTVWGIIYPDLWRFFLSDPVIWDATHDRGWALEQAWLGRLQNKDATLLSWGRDVEDGVRPLVIFNSSIVETGERMLLTPAQLADQQSSIWPTRYFLDMYGEHDMPVSTAARMSATFPYVSPIARPAVEGVPLSANGYQLADGGYFDNHGTVTAIEWLQQILPLAKADGRHKVLVIEIRLYDFLPSAEPKTGFRANWTNTFIGPLTTLLGTWGTTQVQRATVEWSLLQEAHPDMQIQKVAFFPRPKPRCNDAEDSTCSEMLLDPATVPLSWQLSPEQIAFLQESWEERSVGERKQVVDCLERGACGPMQSIFQAE